MPVHKVAGGWKFGTAGKVYPTRRQAETQMEAIYAAGYKEQFGNKAPMKKSPMKPGKGKLPPSAPC
jgi:hypothetical protein